MRISEQHLKHWLEHGYAVVVDFLTPAELAAAQSELVRIFPSLDAYQAPADWGYNYYRGMADYYASITGVSAEYWLAQLMIYAGVRAAK